MCIAEKIAQFIVNTEYTDIPEFVIEQSKFALIDYLSVSFPGADSEDARRMKSYADAENSSGTCSVFGATKKYTSEYAALINGVIAHSLDFDDVGLTAINHPSVVTAPVAFALAEEYGKSGKELLTAYAIGNEAQHQLAAMVMPDLTERGWHTTSVFGTIGAAAVASKLYGLTVAETKNALGLAATMSSGLRVNFGSGTKPYHAGMACRDGVIAAKLAKEGMNCSENVFEGTDGFAQAFTGKIIDAENLHLGQPWDAQIAGYQFKQYPVCSSSHAALNAYSSLMEEYGFTAEEVEHVRVGVSELAFHCLLYPNPQTEKQAKFSMPYAIAAIAVFGKLTLEQVTEETIKMKQIQDFMPKVEMVLDDLYQEAGILNNEPAVVHITLKDGRILERRVEYALGTIKNPMSIKDIKQKYADCTKDWDDSLREKLFGLLIGIESVKNVQSIEKIIGQTGNRKDAVLYCI